MGLIVPFPMRQVCASARQEGLELDEILEGRESAEILLFTGVRYERRDDRQEGDQSGLALAGPGRDACDG